MANGINELFDEVINRGLCAGCGACITGCPYIVAHAGRIVALDKCTGSEGDCYKHCPRTFFDFDGVSEAVFGKAYPGGEMGQVLEIFMARATDPEILKRGQDGGTVTSLLALALEEGLIDAAVSTRMDAEKAPHGSVARSRRELLESAGACYEVGFSLEAYRSLPAESTEKLAIVGTGCQVEALGKIKREPPQNSPDPRNIRFTLGLFCGWALAPGTFHPYLKSLCELSQVCKFEIPPRPRYSFEFHFENDREAGSVSLDVIKPHINSGCHYCWDMTAEFSDVSIGSAETFPGWNTVLVRSPRGAELLALATEKGILETRELPEEKLSHLKWAALQKKRAAVEKITEKSGSKNDLLHIGRPPEESADILSRWNIL
ncbi:MAG: Coenzyme F420 hydrogenase/dehydrogenase, beta subunit C-terminal domain [Syntrophobacteraceae bacterium]|nr:Coenzyme F420 hydrogenase/dehydrogenase, beta subunit C-terminal domain [Syntrophobacteraceae bacterium]